jgi:hypothetical protein
MAFNEFPNPVYPNVSGDPFYRRFMGRLAKEAKIHHGIGMFADSGHHHNASLCFGVVLGIMKICLIQLNS